MRIVAAASSFPRHYYPQPVLIEAFRQYWDTTPEQTRMLERLHARTGVDGRFLALPLERYLQLDRWGETNGLWMEVAEELGQQALCRSPNSLPHS